MQRTIWILMSFAIYFLLVECKTLNAKRSNTLYTQKQLKSIEAIPPKLVEIIKAIRKNLSAKSMTAPNKNIKIYRKFHYRIRKKWIRKLRTCNFDTKSECKSKEVKDMKKVKRNETNKTENFLNVYPKSQSFITNMEESDLDNGLNLKLDEWADMKPENEHKNYIYIGKAMYPFVTVESMMVDQHYIFPFDGTTLAPTTPITYSSENASV